jgi:hypothetical protein
MRFLLAAPSPDYHTCLAAIQDETLASGKPASFFSDEWRCPIYAQVGHGGEGAGQLPYEVPHHLLNRTTAGSGRPGLLLLAGA